MYNEFSFHIKIILISNTNHPGINHKKTLYGKLFDSFTAKIAVKKNLYQQSLGNVFQGIENFWNFEERILIEGLEGKKRRKKGRSIRHFRSPQDKTENELFWSAIVSRSTLSRELFTLFVRIILPLDLLYLSWTLSCLLAFADRRRRRKKENNRHVMILFERVELSWNRFEKVDAL